MPDLLICPVKSVSAVIPRY